MRAGKYFILVIIFASYLASYKNQTIAKNAGNARDWKRDIAAVRYAPPGRYMKDHCFVLKDQKVHLFAPLGKVGTSWEDAGSEETSEHMVSNDLERWEKPEEFAKDGLGVFGTDPCVVRDKSQNRWLCPRGSGVFQPVVPDRRGGLQRVV